jgi:hypothetical protein
MKIECTAGEFDTVVEVKGVGTFEMKSIEKVRRVIDGEPDSKGIFQGALGVEAAPLAVLALYDKKGGLIVGKEGAKVKTGSFYDFKKKAAREKPVITFTFKINGREVEYIDGEDRPLEVRAAELLAQAEEKAQKELAANKARGVK